ncbi:hypothetical protein ACFOOK_18495 [Micromonospora krabiensis]|uniref:Uncharacterized protein n=1 Tax=Micromonospora krabiensis TaxID=307121 RepID=A0A1C3MZ54_9ACTN|nr:hypothetical protein [Micromonospora krabiensis]SBV25564.1 hypothetical protein GA0070620_1041 [Micromonospora krabiensis]
MSTDPGARSMAEVLANTIRIDREDQLEDMIQGLVDLNAVDDLAQLEENTRDWQRSVWSTQHRNPVDGLVAELTSEAMAAMAELTDRPERLARVFVVTLKQEKVMARLRPLPDGSALVLISDATFTLCHLYAGCAAEGMAQLQSGRRLRDLWRAGRAVRDNRLGADPVLLGGLLRYYLVNQRIYALAAKLGHRQTRQTETISLWLSMQAMSFALCHEIAHHVLDHRPAASVAPPGDDQSACPLSEQQEFEADLLGYQAAMRVGRRASAAIPTTSGVDVPELGAALGALVGMLAIHVTEQGLFVRRGRSHPPAPARAARLLDQFSGATRQFAELFLTDLVRATREAVDFSPSGRPFDVAWFSREPRVNSPQPSHYLQAISLLDRLQCRSRDDHAAILARIDKTSPFSLTEGARACLAGDAEAALLSWGVPASTVDEICAPHRALEFSTLVSHLRSSIAAHGVPSEAHLTASVVITQLLVPLLGSRPAA